MEQIVDKCLCEELQEIGYGIRLTCLDNVPTKTLVAFVATGGSLRIGYAYRFHSSVIVYYDDTPYCDLRNRPLKKSFPPVSTWILTFEEITTDKTGYQLTSDDLEFGWLTEDVMEMLMKELGAQRGLWRNTLDEVIDSLHDLSVESLKRVVKYIKLGMPDVEINKLFLNT